MEKMSAIGAFEGIDITNSKALVDLKLDKPTAKDRDLLVEVTAVSVNPVDFKVRQGLKKSETPCVLGWDAVGTVVEIGEQVTDFKLGDRVYYAGEFSRSGSNQAFQLVDDRLVVDIKINSARLKFFEILQWGRHFFNPYACVS